MIKYFYLFIILSISTVLLIAEESFKINIISNQFSFLQITNNSSTISYYTNNSDFYVLFGNTNLFKFQVNNDILLISNVSKNEIKKFVKIEISDSVLSIYKQDNIKKYLNKQESYVAGIRYNNTGIITIVSNYKDSEFSYFGVLSNNIITRLYLTNNSNYLEPNFYSEYPGIYYEEISNNLFFTGFELSGKKIKDRGIYQYNFITKEIRKLYDGDCELLYKIPGTDYFIFWKKILIIRKF